jgi:O-acetyl-ADP-ribose deacetylase (regulator of RNase III)
MNEIAYVTGDASRPQGAGPKIIAHIVNDAGGWGRGFVVALSRRSLMPETAYRAWYRDPSHYSGPFQLGAVQLTGYTQPDVLVANMIAQRGIRHDPSAPPAVDYEALGTCLDRLYEKAVQWGASVHMPRIGCGLGGGDWTAVETEIKATLLLHGVSVTVYDLPTAAAI